MTETRWAEVLLACGVRKATSLNWAPVFANTIRQDTFSAGAGEMDDFLGQVLHESGMLESTIEGLNYSAAGLLKTWPSRFTPAKAAELERRPEAIANHVYGGRMGNTEPGDGWRYRGRGLVMVTGRAGYRLAGKLMGQDLEVLPNLLEQPHFALESAIAWWEHNIPDECLSDCVRITRRVNGGLIGIKHREAVTLAAGKALGRTA
jgi:putative chitinase